MKRTIQSTLCLLGLAGLLGLYLAPVPGDSAVAAERKSSSKTSKTTKSPSKTSKSKATKARKANDEEGPRPSEASRKLVSGLTTTQKSKLLALLNDGTSKDLVSIDGVSKVRSASIIEARPFEKVEEASLVKGIGKVTFEKMIAHGKTLTQRRSSSKKVAKK